MRCGERKAGGDNFFRKKRRGMEKEFEEKIEQEGRKAWRKRTVSSEREKEKVLVLFIFAYIFAMHSILSFFDLLPTFFQSSLLVTPFLQHNTSSAFSFFCFVKKNPESLTFVVAFFSFLSHVVIDFSLFFFVVLITLVQIFGLHKTKRRKTRKLLGQNHPASKKVSCGYAHRCVIFFLISNSCLLSDLDLADQCAPKIREMSEKKTFLQNPQNLSKPKSLLEVFPFTKKSGQ